MSAPLNEHDDACPSNYVINFLRNNSNAFCATRSLNVSRSVGKKNFFAAVRSGVERATKMVPTGLSSEPPLGPAIPVVDRA